MAETVTADQILEGTGKVEAGTFTQRAGLRLAAGVGALGSVVTLIIVGKWAWITWSWPSTVAAGTGGTVEQYKLIQEHTLQVFDAIVARALLPVFTSILGYIFGATRASSVGDPTK